MNSYFQILIDAKGVSLILIPPKDGGEKIKVQELREYLERIGDHATNIAESVEFYLTGNREYL